MGFFTTIIVGLIVGWLASLIMKGKKSLWAYLISGVAGGFLGGLLTSIIFGQSLMSGFNLTSIIVGLVGAVIVIALYRLIKR